MAAEKSGCGCFGGIFAAIVGLVFLIGAAGVIIWNEGRAIKHQQDLAQASTSVITIDAATALPANEGKLIHLTANATTSETLEDLAFGLSMPDTLKLKREVQMYQWKQSKRKSTYKYSKVWDEDLIDSNSFNRKSGHENPRTKPFSSITTSAQTAIAGGFQLSRALIANLDLSEEVIFTKEMLDQALPTVRETARLDGNQIYIGADPSAPAIGDAKVRFELVPAGPVSIVAQQSGTGFQPFKTQSGNDLQIMSVGAKTPAEMFSYQVTKDNLVTWLWRLGGFAVIWFGLLFMSGTMKRWGGSMAIMNGMRTAAFIFVTVLLAAVLTLVFAALGWMVYRPIFAGVLLAGAALLFLIVWMIGKSRNQPREQVAGMISQPITPQAPPPPPPPPLQ